MGVNITDIEEDIKDITSPQEIEPINYNIVDIDWNSKEEDNILERTTNVIEKINSWLRMKKDTCISDQIDHVSNVGLTISGN